MAPNKLTDDPDVDRGVLLRDPFRAQALRRSALEFGVPVVLPVGARGCGTRALDLSKNRHGRFRESDAFRHVFETVLARCMAEGLVSAEGFAIDASVVKADAARASAMPGTAMERLAYGPAQASRAVREYLEGLEAGGRPESARRNISVTDPAAEWTCAPGGPAFLAHQRTSFPRG